MESLVFLADLPQLDLTLLLHSVGVKVWLGKMDVQLTRVRQSYADSAFNGEYITVPAGMRFEADLNFLGMTSLIKFELMEEGVSFVADFNSTEVLKVRHLHWCSSCDFVVTVTNCSTAHHRKQPHAGRHYSVVELDRSCFNVMSMLKSTGTCPVDRKHDQLLCHYHALTAGAGIQDADNSQGSKHPAGCCCCPATIQQ
jgi:hypothetical protein